MGSDRPMPILLEKWAAYCNGRALSQQAKIWGWVKPVTCGTSDFSSSKELLGGFKHDFYFA